MNILSVQLFAFHLDLTSAIVVDTRHDERLIVPTATFFTPELARAVILASNEQGSRCTFTFISVDHGNRVCNYHVLRQAPIASLLAPCLYASS